MENSHPKLLIKIDNKPFKCLIDTGADKTILKQSEIPLHWKLLPGPQLMGVGGASPAFITKEPYRWEDPDGTFGTIRPLVADVTTNLLGRDILEDLNVVLATSTEAGHLQANKITKRLTKQNPQF